MNEYFQQTEDLLDETADLLALNRIDLETARRLLMTLIVGAVVGNIGMVADLFIPFVLGFLAFFASAGFFVAVMLRVDKRAAIIRVKHAQVAQLREAYDRALAAPRN